jgi:exopolysaccharide biosynthesis polyprenyl glycosylphosphotransferase
MQAVSAHAPAVPRARVHAGGFANGHARPRAAASTHWPAATPAATTAVPEVLPFETPESRGLYLKAGKRILDVTAAVLGLVLLSPVIAVLAVIVRATSRGPVFYRSTRIGRGGHPFTFYKLRSMVKDADLKRQHLSHLNEADGPVFKIARDPRITPIGRFMRTTSLDEIPQFWNVLRGDMSLVGPRPPIPEEVAQYEPWQLRRLDVRPGLTCLWQISGRSCIGFQEWMRLDLEYIRHRSLKLDLKILLRTLPAVLSREGAY